MPTDGKFKKQMSLLDLIFVGFGAIFGSGWLFAASHVASIAGPAGWISWLIGGIAVIFLGLVYAELGGAIPRAGGIVRYPVYSHGPLIGFFSSFVTLIAFSSIVSIEVQAARQYAAAWWPSLTQPGTEGLPTVSGWILQFVLLLIFFLLNYWSVGVFSKSNMIITIFKFVVPTLTIVILLTQINVENFQVQGFSPFGLSGIQTAIATGGIMFAYLGIQPIIGFASEAKNPQRTVPIAIIASVVLAAIVYVLLQIAFIGAIPTHLLNGGWSEVGVLFNLPYKDIAVLIGFGWLGTLIVIDAIISPSGTGNIYLASTSRMIFGWAKTGTMFQVFGKIDWKTGIPRPALWLAFALSIFWTLPFPSWSALVGVVSSALVLTFAIAPISAGALRRTAPELYRPFYLKGMSVVGPLSFVIASLIVYWTGWKTLCWLLGIQLVMFAIYFCFKYSSHKNKGSMDQAMKSSWWMVFYYAAMLVLSYFGTFGGGEGLLKAPWDQILLAAVALISYYWGISTGIPKPIFDEDKVNHYSEKSPELNLENRSIS